MFKEFSIKYKTKHYKKRRNRDKYLADLMLEKKLIYTEAIEEIIRKRLTKKCKTSAEEKWLWS